MNTIYSQDLFWDVTFPDLDPSLAIDLINSCAGLSSCTVRNQGTHDFERRNLRTDVIALVDEVTSTHSE
jgi:hypothetical protein